MAGTGSVRLREGDLVAIATPPGPDWPGLVSAVRDAGAALLPLDHRLRPALLERTLARARPTVLATQEGWSRRRGVPVDEGVALVIATSGTAGAPKLAEFEGAAVDAAVSGGVAMLGAEPVDAWLSCLPLDHVGGLLVVLRALALGAPLRVLPRFDPARVARAADARFTSLVSTMLLRLLEAEIDLSAFRAILVGASAMPHELRDRARGAGAAVVQTYGLTESCGGVVYDGRPFPGVELRVDPVSSAIELRGPTLMHGYRLDPEATARALGSGGWLRTADAGRLDRDGTLHVLGRLDDLIKTGGERVWPEEVEAALRTAPGIADIAVVGRPDPEWGERVVAVVVPESGADPPELERLREHAAHRLPRYALPRELAVVTGPLPRSASGKVRRADFRQDGTRQVELRGAERHRGSPTE